jgi:hypothetical protein
VWGCTVSRQTIWQSPSWPHPRVGIWRGRTLCPFPATQAQHVVLAVMYTFPATALSPRRPVLATDRVSPHIKLEYEAARLPALHQAIRDAGAYLALESRRPLPSPCVVVILQADPPSSCSLVLPRLGLSMAPFRQGVEDKSHVQHYGEDFVYSVALIAKRLGLSREWDRNRVLHAPSRTSEGG